MAERKCKMKNLDSVLVKVRTGDAFLSRRFGTNHLLKNFQLSLKLMKFKNVGLIFSFLRMLKFIFIYILPRKLQYFLLKKYNRNY